MKYITLELEDVYWESCRISKDNNYIKWWDFTTFNKRNYLKSCGNP